MSDIELSEPAAVAPIRQPDLTTNLLVYRILAYTVGTGLVVLVCIGLPLQFWGHNKIIATYVGIAHGWLFMIYLIVTFTLAARARWNMIRVVWVGLAGTIPFLSFYAERKVTGWVRSEQKNR
jgi:integral membrane protein